MTLKKGSRGPEAIGPEDLQALIAEIAFPGSQVDTLLVCVNAQVLYYPTKAGTMRGALSTPEERERWPEGEKRRFANLQAMFERSIDPYAVILAEAKRRGLEALLTFRMNDAHGNDFLRTAFWRDHPGARLPGGALDFGSAEVRDYVFRLIAEAVGRYDADGIELDFQRFPTFFKGGEAEERAAATSALVERARRMLDAEGARRGQRLVLAARAPSDYGKSPPSPEKAREIGCDPILWARRGWIDFLTVSEFLFERYDLPLRLWKERLGNVPIYGGIECAEGPKLEQCLTPEKYRRAARHLWGDGANGIYLFNFFTTRESGKDAFEPPFEVLRELGDPAALARRPEIVELQKIWDQAPHNAFTDLLRFRDAWLCAFREGSGHIPGTDGTIRILRGDGGERWESASSVVEKGIDLRDPKLSVAPEGRLMLLMGGSTYAGEEGPLERRFVKARTRVSFSTDGQSWSAPEAVSVEGEWLWRITWREGIGYGFGYTFLAPAEKVELTLWRTRDGLQYEKVASPRPPPECWPDETTIRFLPDGAMVALVRGEQKNHRATIGRSRPPYGEWRWADGGHAAQGPNFIALPSGRWIYGGRDYPDGARTVLGELSPVGLDPLLVLPSGGDTSYPGLAWHGGLLWISYYSSHEGKAAVYLAKVKWPAE